MAFNTPKMDEHGAWLDFAEDPDFLCDTIGLVATQFLHFDGQPFYPTGALVKSKVFRVWLGTGASALSSDADIIFKMPPFEDQATDFRLFEIVLRTSGGAAYGGWVFGDQLTVLDKFFSGHRVIEAKFRGEIIRFAYDPSLGRFQFQAGDLAGLSTGEVRAIAKIRQRD